MEGNIVSQSVRLQRSLTSHPTEDRLSYIIYVWSYLRQEECNGDKVRPPDGTCGSAIWDDDGVILGVSRIISRKDHGLALLAL